MKELNKYEQLKEIREQIRDLSWNLGNLIEMIKTETIDDKSKDIIEEQAWKLVERINEISKK